MMEGKPKTMSDGQKIFQLLFDPNKPYPAKSRVVCRGGCYGEGRNGEVLLTPECVNPTEVIVWIDDRIKQLEEMKPAVRRRYAAYNENQRWTALK